MEIQDSSPWFLSRGLYVDLVGHFTLVYLLLLNYIGRLFIPRLYSTQCNHNEKSHATIMRIVEHYFKSVTNNKKNYHPHHTSNEDSGSKLTDDGWSLSRT